MNKKHILVLKIAFFMFVGSNGAYMSFINLHLEQVVGLTGTQIGLVSFLGMIAMVVMNPIWGYIGDKTGKHVGVLKISFFGAALAGALYFGVRSLFLVIVAAILLEGVRAAILPLLDFMGTTLCEKVGYDFGKVRVWASLGFLIIAILSGFMIGGLHLPRIGFSMPPLMTIDRAAFGLFIVLNLIGFGMMFFLPKKLEDEKETNDKKGFSKDDLKSLIMNKHFRFVLAYTIFTIGVMEAAFSYNTMHLVTQLGATENIVSFVVFFMVGPELLFLMNGTRLVRSFGVRKWYIFATITMIFRLTVYGLTTEPWLFILAGSVHGIGIVTFAVANLKYIRTVISRNVLGLAFTILASMMALSRAIFNFIFGWVYENISSFSLFLIGAGIVCGALVMVIMSKSLKEVGSKIDKSHI